MTNNPPIQVLYVEDSPIQARSGIRAVRHIGGELVLANTGAAALEAAETGTFDLILFDLGLPDMDGFELLQRMRHSFPAIPILVVTGFSPPGLRESCLKAGATDFLMKPIDTNELEALLRKHITASAC